MQAGKLDQRIVVKAASVTSQNSYGEDVVTVTTVGTFWASVGFVTGREPFMAGQRFAEAKYKIKLRRQPNVILQRAQSVEWNGQTLDVLDIQGPGTRQPDWLIIARDHVE